MSGDGRMKRQVTSVVGKNDARRADALQRQAGAGLVSCEHILESLGVGYRIDGPVVLSTPGRAPKPGGSSEFLEGRRHGLDAEVEVAAPQDGTKAGGTWVNVSTIRTPATAIKSPEGCKRRSAPSDSRRQRKRRNGVPDTEP